MQPGFKGEQAIRHSSTMAPLSSDIQALHLQQSPRLPEARLTPRQVVRSASIEVQVRLCTPLGARSILPRSSSRQKFAYGLSHLPAQGTLVLTIQLRWLCGRNISPLRQQMIRELNKLPVKTDSVDVWAAEIWRHSSSRCAGCASPSGSAGIKCRY